TPPGPTPRSTRPPAPRSASPPGADVESGRAAPAARAAWSPAARPAPPHHPRARLTWPVHPSARTYPARPVRTTDCRWPSPAPPEPGMLSPLEVACRISLAPRPERAAHCPRSGDAAAAVRAYRRRDKRTISFAATLALYELAIRRFRVTRFLFGM